MRRDLKKSEAVAKSEFYLNSTKEVLNNTIATALTWQLFLLGLNKRKSVKRENQWSLGLYYLLLSEYYQNKSCRFVV